MPARKKLPQKRSPGRTDVIFGGAIASGQNAANDVIAFRAKQLRKRATIEKNLPESLLGFDSSQVIPPATLDLLGTKKTAGVLIAEGDSWFDYPMNDILQMLEDDHLFDVESVAHKGDCVEDMAHSKGQFEEFARRLEKLLRDNKVPRAILLSGGGNDIAGNEFVILLNHAASKLPPLNEDIVRGLIDVRLKEAYASMIGGLTTIAKSYLDRPIPIVTHGYDYPIPDGRGFMGGWWILPGPWLKPGFQKKGHDDLARNTQLIVQLIDRFNAMLKAVSARPEFAHVHYLDLRGTLKHDGTYKKHWANEMHPNSTGFDLVTKKFANVINKL